MVFSIAKMSLFVKKDRQNSSDNYKSQPPLAKKLVVNKDKNQHLSPSQSWYFCTIIVSLYRANYMLYSQSDE